MPIPKFQIMLLPVLQVLADGAEHHVIDIRERMKTKFQVTSDELSQKHINGMPVFINRVAWALANLNMEQGPNGHSTAITLTKKEMYKITAFGIAILKKNPSSLTIKDLMTI
jgi:restriction endonuclease Mrr